MHELSIAQSIVELVRRATPAGTKVTVVHLRAGPMRGIEAEAMSWAWQSAVIDTELAHSTIDVEQGPWPLQCPACGVRFDSAELYTPCACGCREAHPTGGDELQLVSVTVEDE